MSMVPKIFFVDTEVSVADGKVRDMAALSMQDEKLHTQSITHFLQFVSSAEYLCGHNIIHHDLKHLPAELDRYAHRTIDSLYLSPLLFPRRPYHRLLKDDKLLVDEINNPLNDCVKAKELFLDELNAFFALPEMLKQIYCSLLYSFDEFGSFFDYVGVHPDAQGLEDRIYQFFKGKICENKNIRYLISQSPVELAYALALINTDDRCSLTPPWLLKNYPRIENILSYLCNTPCEAVCPYCAQQLDVYKGLKDIFGYSQFRLFDGEPMQENAVRAAVHGDSLLTIFPTGGGKSLTFQLPAIMAGRNVHGLTVIISPLQSLMKDQVDNLVERGLTEAVTINGMLDPVSRSNAFMRVADGSATLLYISPEMLRSKTIEKLLLSRNVVRFVIDEAHCFSAWGHDFRVDYLYIGDFIKKLQEKKGLQNPIPVSCFTATAKQKVITDICDYFKRKLSLDLRLFASSSNRKNLKYSVLYAETEEEKYNLLRGLMTEHNCPTIIYVSRTRRTKELADKLSSDGFPTYPFHGKMEANDKIKYQNAFIQNEVRAIVATSAFGMGVDKKDVGLVVHFDISDSLENYVQEAGRAGRNPDMEAKCYVLYSDKDLDKHFILLNQTKLSISEIQQVWSAIKGFTRQRKSISCSALEIAREAGWDDSVADVETRVRTAVAALEDAGYITRGNNVPHVFATGIMVKNMDEARKRLTDSPLFDEETRVNAIRIIKSLISCRSIENSQNDEAESRVDYLADILGMTKTAVVSAVNLMRQDGILADSQDMSAFIDKTENRSLQIFHRFAALEKYLLQRVEEHEIEFSYKELNEQAALNGVTDSSVKSIRTLFYFLTVKGYLRKYEVVANDSIRVVLSQSKDKILEKQSRRLMACDFFIHRFYQLAVNTPGKDAALVQFSLTSMLKEYNAQHSQSLFAPQEKLQLEDVQDALLYLSKIGAMKLEGGFMVLYNAMEIQRLVDNKYRYKMEDYRMLDEFYKQKIRQIHIVGEYANLMVRDYNAALRFVQDYFQMDFKKFISTYFAGKRATEIEKNITPAKYEQLFGELSVLQKNIIQDSRSKYIVVAAGPGSGKTKVLVHKLASLLLLEDVKHEQLLMLTFSRAAATEFKKRLLALIGNAAHYVEIKTFHSYCFDLIGKVGNLEDAGDVVQKAASMIELGEVEPGRINKTVLVIDEAQDMDETEFSLVRALMSRNEEMRVVAVGDDDQNIYQFRGADSAYMRSMIDEFGASKYEMVENYRSSEGVVRLANAFVQQISVRMKSAPIVSMRHEKGFVSITEYGAGVHMEQPLVDQIISTCKGEKACVLTRTNEEALRIVCLLNRHGLKAKLIQSMDGFRFSNLAEIRYFLKLIDKDLKTPVIPETLWLSAREKTLQLYGEGEMLNLLRNFFSEFEAINEKVKYRSDLTDFVFESNVEDFCQENGVMMYVSTIHKAKGREFDTVYMMLSNYRSMTDDTRRSLYVGFTRAKNCLFIHCDNQLFSPFRTLCDEYRLDTKKYDEPDELVIQLSHKDVYLDFFKDKKRLILGLRCGDKLIYDNFYLKNQDGQSVASLSAKAKSVVQEIMKNGYVPQFAKTRFVVAWKGSDDKEESAVLLADLFLKREG